MGAAWSRLASSPARGRVLLGVACVGVLGYAWWFAQQRKQALDFPRHPLHPTELKIENSCNIEDIYDLETKKIGEGSFGAVVKARKRATGESVAVKRVSKARSSESHIAVEIHIMKSLEHRNIMKLLDTYDSEKDVFLVMELCLGGELFARIVDSGHFSEPQAAHCMIQILSATKYCHSVNICYRSIKPEDILCVTKDPIQRTDLKLVDWGLATRFTPGVPMTTKAGTPYYVAPQVLTGSYDMSCDLWSCGVILYIMLCGYPPFYGETDVDVLAKVLLGNFSFNAADWKQVSEAAKNLVRMLLKMNPAERYTAGQALSSPWIGMHSPSVVLNIKRESQKGDDVEIALINLGGNEAARFSYKLIVKGETLTHPVPEVVREDASKKLGLAPEQIKLLLPDGSPWESSNGGISVGSPGDITLL